MTTNTFRYLLFPHMTLAEKEARCLSVLLPHVSLMQILRPPTLPSWAKGQFSALPVVTHETQRQQIETVLRGYREYADLHGKGGAMLSLSHDLIAREAMESRLGIQSILRGHGEERLDTKGPLLLEAEVFLEMARDLEENEADLESSIEEVEGLEEEFREILGITDGEELDEAVISPTPTLRTERAGPAFMLHKRIVFWFRLLPDSTMGDCPVFVTASRDALEEVLDPLIAEGERKGRPLGVLQLGLATLPSLEVLEEKEFESLREELLSSTVHAQYRQHLDDLLREPGNAKSAEALSGSSALLKEYVEDFCRKKGKDGLELAELTLTVLKNRSVEEVCKGLDREGTNAGIHTLSPHRSPSLFILINWH